MIRIVTLSAAALVAATSFASAGNIFADLAAQSDDRATYRAITNTGVSGVTFGSNGGSSAEIFADIAAQDDDRAAVRALSGKSVDGVSFSTKGTSVSALEVALKHAIEDDNRMLAAHIAKKLGR